MLRVLVAVALSVALLAASMPAIQTARVDHAHDRMEMEVDSLVATASRLQERNDPAPHGLTGARQTVELRLPDAGWTAAPVAYLEIPGPASELSPGTVRYRVAEGRERTRSTAAPVVGPPGGLRLDSATGHRLRLEYTQRRGKPVVMVRYVGFKLDAVTRPGHDTHSALGVAWRPGTG